MASEKHSSPANYSTPAASSPLYPSIPAPATQGAAAPSPTYPGYTKVPHTDPPSPSAIPTASQYNSSATPRDLEAAARALPPPTTTVTRDKSSRKCCANTRSCVCCNCCGIPASWCRGIWCLLLLVFVGLGATAGIMAAKCAAAPPVRVDEGKVDLGTFKEGEFKIESRGWTDFGSFNLVTGAPGSDLTWRVEHYSQRSEDKWPKAATSQSGSTWSLFPNGSPDDHWLGWFGLMLSFGPCEGSVTTLTVPSDLHSRSGNYSLTVAMRNAGIKLTPPALGEAKTGWSSVSLSSTNGGIKVMEPLAVQRAFAISTTNGGVHVNRLDMRDRAAQVNIESTNGGIFIDRLELAQPGAKVNVGSTNGGITLGLRPPAFPQAFSAEVGSTNGGVSVRLPKDESLAWTMKTTNGGVQIDGEKKKDSTGVLGQGGGEGRQLSLSSSNGGLNVETNLP